MYSYSYFEAYSNKLRIFLKLREGNLSCLTFCLLFSLWNDNDIRIMFLEFLDLEKITNQTGSWLLEDTDVVDLV